MRINPTFTNVIDHSTQTRTLNVDESESLGGTLERIGHPYGELRLSDHFAVKDASSENGQLLPFVITTGKVRWGVFYRDITWAELQETLPPLQGSLVVRVGMPQAGGPDIYDPLVLWKAFYSTIQALDPLFGVGGGLAGIWALFRRLFRPNPPRELRNVHPGAVFSLIVSRDSWTAIGLAETCGISCKDAKRLLELCRYQRDAGSKSFRRSAKTADVVDRLIWFSNTTGSRGPRCRWLCDSIPTSTPLRDGLSNPDPVQLGSTSSLARYGTQRASETSIILVGLANDLF